MLVVAAGMYLYSRSIPVAFISTYIVSWFIPASNLYPISMEFSNALGILEFIYLFCFIRINQKKSYWYSVSLKYIIPIILVLTLVAVFSTQIPMINQLKGVVAFLLYLFNVIIVACCIKSSREFKKVVHLLLLVIVISSIYGIYTYIEGFNPFAELVLLYNSDLAETGLGANYIEDARGLLKGRVSAFTVHPLLFGGIMAICLFVVMQYIQYLSKYKKRLLGPILIVICLTMVFLSGSRSILIGTIIGLYYYFYSNSPRIALSAGFLFLVFLFGVGITIEDDFIRSTLFFWEESQEVSGSSGSMRMMQFEAAFDVIDDDISSFLFGLGRGWAGQYGEKYGCVPPFYGFESIFLSSLVNMGVFGTCLYIYAIFYPLYKITKQNVQSFKDRSLVYSLLICGFLIFTLTGDVYGMKLYIVLTFFMIKWCESSMPLSRDLSPRKRIAW